MTRLIPYKHPTGAVISDCGKYRYKLTRKLSDSHKSCLFIMLNPSTADANEDDPTIRRCMGYAIGWGYGELIVVNLFAYRATKPTELYSRLVEDPIGPENHHYVTSAVDQVTRQYLEDPIPNGPTICAWGTHGSFMNQDQTVLGWIESAGVTPMCLQKTKAGHPSHPLYLKKGLMPTTFGGRHAT